MELYCLMIKHLHKWSQYSGWTGSRKGKVNKPSVPRLRKFRFGWATGWDSSIKSCFQMGSKFEYLQVWIILKRRLFKNSDCISAIDSCHVGLYLAIAPNM